MSKSEPMDAIGLSDAADVAAVVLGVTTTVEFERTDENTKWYRRCTHCWPTMRGLGRCHTTIPPDDEDSQIGRRYYTCDRCGLGFSREFKVMLEVVTRRRVVVIDR